VKRGSFLALAVIAGLVVVVGFVSRSDAVPLAGSATARQLRIATFATSSIDLARSDNAYTVSNLALETVVKIAPNGKVVPNLARSISHPSPRVWIYRLRKGIKFWDGNELTAEDVANSVKYYRSAGSLISYQYPVTLRAIKATGRYTVQVTLKQKDASWPFVLTYAGVFEKKFQSAHKKTYGQPGTLTMGTGPFKIDSFDPTRGIKLSANRKYWGGKVLIDRVSFSFFNDETSMALAFRAGQIDLAFPDNAQAWKATSGSNVIAVPSANSGVLIVPTKTAPWSDIHVRRAIAYAVNKKALLTAFNGGYGKQSNTFIPAALLRALGTRAQVDALVKSLPAYPQSLTKAREEMAKSAYPNGFNTSFLVLNSPAYVNMAQAVAAELKPLGITVDISPLGDAAFNAEATGDKSKTRLYVGAAGCVGPDPGQCYDYFLGSKNIAPGGWNMANYAPPAVDDLIKEGFATTNPIKRLAVYRKLLRRLNTDLPYIPLFVYSSNLALSSKFTWPTWKDLNGFWYDAGAVTNLIKPRK
jgi:peptide/nickel transport system substrate-binding protein